MGDAMNTIPIPGLCTKCGIRPIAMENGNAKWCWQCLGVDPNIVPPEYGGAGKVIDLQPGNESPNVIQIPFTRHPKKGTAVKGVDVIFVDGQGNKTLVRTTEAEQMDIARKLTDNRRCGKRTFQFASVAVLPLAVAQRMEEIVHLASANDPKAQTEALKMLAEVSEKGSIP